MQLVVVLYQKPSTNLPALLRAFGSGFRISLLCATKLHTILEIKISVVTE